MPRDWLGVVPLILFLVFPGAAFGQGVVINEFMASNGSTIANEVGEYSDWIELYNPGATAVDIGGWGLSDDVGAPFQWVFPAGTVLHPGAYLLVWASGKDTSTTLAFHDLVPAEGAWRYHDQGQDLGTAWRTPGYDDSGWTSGHAPLGYPGTRDGRMYARTVVDFGSSTSNKHITSYFRRTFTVADAAAVEGLVLHLWLDDGAVVYLNGVEVARENLPAGEIDYQTRSPTYVGQWPDWTQTAVPVERLQTGVNTLAVEVHQYDPSSSDLAFDLQLVAATTTPVLHAGFSIAADGEDLLLTRPDGQVVDFVNAIAVPRDVSYGRQPDGAADWYFFAAPTPGGRNAGGVPGVADAPVFSHLGGPVTGAFELTLSTATPGGTIRYTLDGGLPTEASPVYTGPLLIDRSRQVRGRVFAADRLPGPVVTHTYVFLAPDVMGFSSDLPLVVVDCLGATNLPDRKPDHTGFVAFFEPDADGRTRLTSVPAVQSRAGLRRRGESTLREMHRKPNLAVETWHDDRDEDRDIAPLGLPAESDWILYAPDDWDGALLRSPLASILATGAGEYAFRWRFVEVFLRVGGGALSQAHYAGLYLLMESIKRGENRVDIAALQPGHNTEPEISGGYIFRQDKVDDHISGFSAGGSQLQFYRPRDPTQAQRAWLINHINGFRGALNRFDFTDPVTGYAAWIDVDNWVNVNLIKTFTANIDWPWFSAYYHKDRGGLLRVGPIWDFDRSMGSRDDRDDDPEVWVHGGAPFNLAPWWSRLFEDPDFWQRYTDRWQALRADLVHDESLERYISEMAETLAEAGARNYSRWRGTFVYRYGGWEGEINHLRGWLLTRAAWIDSQIPPTPAFDTAEGLVMPGTPVGLTLPAGAAGTVYLTTDGSDPRAPGGGVAASAFPYAGSLTIEGHTVIRARTWDGQSWQGMPSPIEGAGHAHIPWSAMAEATYVIMPVPAAIETLIEGTGPSTFGVAALFPIPDGDAPAYAAESDTPGVVTAEISHSTLTLTPLGRGEARVTVTANDGMNPPAGATFRVLVYPAAHPLASGPYRFGAWSPDEPAGSYPDHMLFLQGEGNDSELDSPLEYAYRIPHEDAGQAQDAEFPYRSATRTRINGLAEDGIAFINTGRGRDLGGALVALDTRNVTHGAVEWLGGTLLPNTRIYALRLQYRVGTGGPFIDVLDADGQPVLYTRDASAGHEAPIGPVFLPLEALDEAYVQVLWRYYRVSGDSGARAQLRLDEIVVANTVTPPGSFAEWQDRHFGLAERNDPAISGPTADPEGTGFPNLLRYSLGLGRHEEGRGSQPLASTAGEVMRYSHRRLPGERDVTYIVLVCDDLAVGDWIPAIDGTHLVFESVEATGDGITEMVRYTVFPPATGTSLFLRLQVLLSP